MKTKRCVPQTLGWLETKLDPHQMSHLERCIEKAKGSAKSKLAGNISTSLNMKDEDDFFWLNVLQPHIAMYMNEFGEVPVRSYTRTEKSMYLDTFWVNYQKQGEFNPAHHHGGIYSFVVWMNIPTHWKDQYDQPWLEDIVPEQRKASNFEFTYTDILGGMRHFDYRLDPSSNGTMLFFPSSLIHAVYPFFNCEENRITISGNICV